MSKMLEQLAEQSTSSSDGAHRVVAKSACTKDVVTVTIPIEEILQAHKTPKKHKDGPKKGEVIPGEFNKSVGFMLEPIPFVINGDTYYLKPGWVSVSK